MTNQLDLMMTAVVIVAFIAGYSVVSFVVRRLKVGKGTNDEQNLQTPGNDFSRRTDDDKL